MSNPAEINLTGLELDRSSEEPLHSQLAQHIRTMIRQEAAHPGDRLPPTREAARQLGVARNTVVLAFENLRAEGFVEARQGSGSFIAQKLPDPAVVKPGFLKQLPELQKGELALSDRGERYASFIPEMIPHGGEGPFSPNAIDTSMFPIIEWRRIYARNLAKPSLRGMTDAQGHKKLREAIASHLKNRRALNCSPDEVVLFSSTRQAIFLFAHVLLDEGDPVLMEDPGYPFARSVFGMAGLNIINQRVDADGMVIADAPPARMAYVTPSWQIPAGRVLSFQRRLELLEWASANNAWVIEDDYDCEYRYSGYAQAALKSIDDHNRVLYLGTFNNTLYPSLHISYAVAPAAIVRRITLLKKAIFGRGRMVEEGTLASFIKEGKYARLMRRIRLKAAARMDALLDSAKTHFPRWAVVERAPAGMHVVAWLPSHIDDAEVTAELERRGITTMPISGFCREQRYISGLVLFYTAFTEQQIRKSIQIAGEVLHQYESRTS